MQVAPEARRPEHDAKEKEKEKENEAKGSFSMRTPFAALTSIPDPSPENGAASAASRRGASPGVEAVPPKGIHQRGGWGTSAGKLPAPALAPAGKETASFFGFKIARSLTEEAERSRD